MIKATFSKDYTYFKISGHSGYAEAGSDIICASVSSMANLVCNAIDKIGGKAEVRTEEQEAVLEYRMTEPKFEAFPILETFYEELRELEKQYPKYVRVTKI